MARITISGWRTIDGRVRCNLGEPGAQYPNDNAKAGDRVLALAAGADGSDLEFTVAKVETRPAKPGRVGVVWYTPEEGSVQASGGLTPDSSEEQLAREEGRAAGRTGELPGA